MRQVLLIFVLNYVSGLEPIPLRNSCRGKGSCTWLGNGLYVGAGCTENGRLSFDRFYFPSVLDLSQCETKILVVNIASTDIQNCNFLRNTVGHIKVYLGDNEISCVHEATIQPTPATSYASIQSTPATSHSQSLEQSMKITTQSTSHSSYQEQSPRLLISSSTDVHEKITSPTQTPTPTAENNEDGGENMTILITSSIITTSLTVLSIITASIILIARYIRKRHVRKSLLPYRVTRMRPHFDAMHNILDSLDTEL